MDHTTPRLRRCLAPILLGVLCLAAAPPSLAQTVRSASFDQDPHWDAVNNHITPAHLPTITQDFGYGTTHTAGTTPGEIGGLITRAAKPAYYADTVHKTLNDPLSATGTLAISRSSASSGIFFGWFNSHQPGGGGRPMNSLGLDIDGEHAGARLAVRLITASNKSVGTFITPFRKGFRPTPLKNDGARYTWHLSYDPAANHNTGEIHLTLGGQSTTLPLKPSFRRDGARFTHFGLFTSGPGGQMVRLYLDDLKYTAAPTSSSPNPEP